MTQLTSPIGLVAGSGEFPLEFLRSARKRNLEVVVVAHKNESLPELEAQTDKISWISVGQLSKLIGFFKKNNVRQVSILGGIRRSRLFRELWPDWRAIRLITKLPSLKDDCVLRGLAGELEREGFSVFSASEILSECLARKGQLSKRSFSESEQRSAQLAWQAAKTIGALDIGQGAVAFKDTVVALEAVEGTDRMLHRVAELIDHPAALGQGAVLAKVSKPKQDLRLDLPAVGCDTLKNMHNAGITGLVLEADKALIASPAEFTELANSLNIAVTVWDESSNTNN